MTNSDEADAPRLLIAVLAAGASSRMGGRDKLLEPVAGQPLLRAVVRRVSTLGAPVIVTLPVGGPRHDALRGTDAMPLPVPDAAHGMSASFRALARVAEGRAIMAVLADMPDLTDADFAAVVAHWRAAPVRIVRAATWDGLPGQPVILPARLVPRLARLSGDAGAREILAGEDVELVRLAGDRARVDLDTPGDWAAWRARTGISR